MRENLMLEFRPVIERKGEFTFDRRWYPLSPREMRAFGYDLNELRSLPIDRNYWAPWERAVLLRHPEAPRWFFVRGEEW